MISITFIKNIAITHLINAHIYNLLSKYENINFVDI